MIAALAGGAITAGPEPGVARRKGLGRFYRPPGENFRRAW